MALSSPALIKHLGTTAPSRDAPAYLPHVDGLRAVAILVVVIYHARPAWLPGGFIGVDVFFVISGFLITRLIINEVEAGRFSLVSFYARRMRRLMPAAIATFIGVSALSYFILLPDALIAFGKSLTNAALFVSNFFFLKHSGYFDGPSHLMPLLHTWSLSVEEQFYFFWPVLLLVLLPRIGRRTMLAIALLLCALSLGYAQYKLGFTQGFVFYMLVTRFWELGVGAALALIIERLRLHQGLGEALAIGGLGAILSSAVMLSKTSIFPGLAAAPAVIGTAVIIAAGFQRRPLVVRALAWRPVVFVGLISYSLYLWHWPLLALARYHLQRELMLVEVMGLVALAFGLAVLSWRFVERPFRHRSAFALPDTVPQQTAPVFEKLTIPALRKPHNDHFVLRAGGLAIVLVALLGGTFNWGKGWPRRLEPALRHVFEQMAEANPLRRSCDGFDKIFANDEVCNFGRAKRPGKSYQLAIMGDSNGDHFVPLAKSIALKAGLSGRQVTQSACGPIIGVENQLWNSDQRRRCLAYQRNIVKFLDENRGLKFVILSAAWTSYITKGSNPNIVPSSMELPGSVRAKVAKLGYKPGDSRYYFAATVLYMRARGISVLLLGQVPHYYKIGGLPVRCVVNAVNTGKSPDQCGISEQLARVPLKPSDELFERLADLVDGVSVFLPAAQICKNGLCRVMASGKFLYRNPGHLSNAGARYFAGVLPFPDALK